MTLDCLRVTFYSVRPQFYSLISRARCDHISLRINANVIYWSFVPNKSEWS
jgi:protocatechuate 3,4-dioxygenase beta subunit